MKYLLSIFLIFTFFIGLGSPAHAYTDASKRPNNSCYTCHSPSFPVMPPASHTSDLQTNQENCMGCHGNAPFNWQLKAPDAPVGPVDADGDNVAQGDDCNDNDASIHPGAAEIPYDGIDQDCDGSDLDDVDQDGFGKAEDCNDQDANIHPKAAEILDNDVDENCDGIAEVTPSDDGSQDDATDDSPVDDGTVDDNPVDDGAIDDNPVDDGTIDDNPVDDGSIDDNPVDDNSDTDTNCDTDGAGGCDHQTTCNPCKWSIPCGPAKAPPADLVIDVDIDVNPCITPNFIRTGAKGFVTVVIKGSEELNVHTIDTGSILMANAKPVRFYLKYVTCHRLKNDFKKDMVLIFRSCELSLDANTTEITLTGKTLSGVSFTGTDTAKVIDCNQQ